MAAFLQSHPEANVLYAHNDDMALGAIQSIEAAGKKPGTDIKIVSVDGVHDGFVAMSQGKINAIVECNPLLGPQLMETIKQVLAGQTRREVDQDEGERLPRRRRRRRAAQPQVLTPTERAGRPVWQSNRPCFG